MFPKSSHPRAIMCSENRDKIVHSVTLKLEKNKFGHVLNSFPTSAKEISISVRFSLVGSVDAHPYARFLFIFDCHLGDKIIVYFYGRNMG